MPLAELGLVLPPELAVPGLEQLIPYPLLAEKKLKTSNETEMKGLANSKLRQKVIAEFSM